VNAISWDAISAIGVVGQFVVVAVAALAAFQQLRHLRKQRQYDAVQNMLTQYESDAVSSSRLYVYDDLAGHMQDAEYRERIRSGRIAPTTHPEFRVGRFFNKLGTLISVGVIDGEIALSQFAQAAPRIWECLLPVIALRRSRFPSFWLGFESFVVLCRSVDYEAYRPAYIRRTPRRLRGGWNRTSAEVQTASELVHRAVQGDGGKTVS
jgi:hypothetical protein